MNNLHSWLKYINAWIAYAGALFTQISKISDTVIDSITSISIPKKSDYINGE
jgi:hypothetical protein